MKEFETALLGKWLKDSRGTVLKIVAVWINETPVMGTLLKQTNIRVMAVDDNFAQRLITLPDTDYDLYTQDHPDNYDGEVCNIR